MKNKLKILTKVNAKIYILLLSVILGLMGVLTTMFGIYSQQYNYYEFYSNDNIDKISIDDIYIGDSLVDLNNYSYKNTVYNKKEKVLEIVTNNNNNNKKFYKITVSKIDNLKILFKNKSNSDYKILVSKNGKNYATFKIVNGNEYNFIDNIRTLSILKSTICSMCLSEILIYLTIFILLVFISYISINYIYKFILGLKNNIFSVRRYIVSIILYFGLNLLYMYLLMQIIGKFCIFPSIFLLIITLIFLKDNIKKNLDYSFSIIGMIVGVLFILIFPPLHIPDETSHFIKTYQQSYIFQEKHVDKSNETYAYLPKDMRKFINKYGSYVNSNDYVMQPRTYLFDLYKPTNYKDYSEKYNWYGTRFSSPLPYVTGMIVALIARITSMPVLMYYLLGKLFTLIISLIMCYYALKITPKFKKVFFIIMLLPMFFQQCAGYCMDWLTNASFLLITSLILKEVYSKGKIDKKNIFKIIVLLIILGFCKFGYFSISLLLLLIPKERYNSKDEKTKIFFIMFIPLIVSVFITYLYRILSMNVPIENYRDCISISMLFQNPKEILSMIINTFKIRLDLDFIRGMVTGFGWYTFWLNDLYLFISMFILTILIICNDDNNKKLSTKQYAIIFTIFLITCGIIYGAMLFGWTIKGSTSIDGLQPRYFIPPSLLLYILLQSNFVKIKIKNKNLLYSISMIILNVFALITIIETIYI